MRAAAARAAGSCLLRKLEGPPKFEAGRRALGTRVPAASCVAPVSASLTATAKGETVCVRRVRRVRGAGNAAQQRDCVSRRSAAAAAPAARPVQEASMVL